MYFDQGTRKWQGNNRNEDNTAINTADMSSSYFINKKLDLKNLEFTAIDIQYLKYNYFTIPTTSAKGKPSSYIYDSYNKAELYCNLLHET